MAVRALEEGETAAAVRDSEEGEISVVVRDSGESKPVIAVVQEPGDKLAKEVLIGDREWQLLYKGRLIRTG